MSMILRICLFLFSVLLFSLITHILKKEKMPIKYALIWYFSALIILVLAIFPNILEFIASLFGFETTSNLVVGILITILLYITLSTTIIMSGQNKKIKLLIQEISILKKSIGDEKK